VSPARTELFGGVIFTPLEVAPDAAAFMPPPQADPRQVAIPKSTMPVNLTRKDVFVATISDPLSLKIRTRK
jgi:hypothetical protein